MREGLKHREESLVEGIRDAASTLMEDVSKLGEATREAASHSIGRAEKKLQKNVSALYERGQEKAQKMGTQMQGYVAKNPFRALMIAAGAGFILGFLKRGR